MPRSIVEVRKLLATALVLVSAAAPAQTSSTASRGVIEAIWRVQQFDFDYRTTRGSYACDALRARLANVLRALGAHESVRVEMSCAGPRQITGVRARISVAVPVEATEENLQAATAFDARTRLLARLGKLRLPTAAQVERFPAAWRRVPLGPRGRYRFDAGDCELLRDVQQQIFPQLRVRSGAKLYCVPWATRMTQTLEAVALVRVSDG